MGRGRPRKLKAEQVQEIRRVVGVNQKVLAKRFGVSQPTISRITITKGGVKTTMATVNCPVQGCDYAGASQGIGKHRVKAHSNLVMNARLLKADIAKAGLSMRSLGPAIGRSQTTISNLLYHEGFTSRETLEALATHIGVRPYHEYLKDNGGPIASVERAVAKAFNPKLGGNGFRLGTKKFDMGAALTPVFEAYKAHVVEECVERVWAKVTERFHA